MAVIAPFMGMMYNFGALGEPSALMAPPYDVISEEEQADYYARHPKNVIRLILGKRKKGDSDWDNRYTRSADTFTRWQSEDVFLRSPVPALYVTSLTFDPGEGKGLRTRWGLIALVGIEEEGSGGILPHERTFSAHKDDRLKLMRACNAQFSQVFGLFEDAEDRVFSSLREAIDGLPLVDFEFVDGTRHRVWTVQKPAVFNAVAKSMLDKTIFIADGHHRYETARNFRNIMRARYGQRPPNRSYEYVMMYLTNMSDRGLTILPAHRLIKGCADFEAQSFLGKLRAWFKIRALPAEALSNDAAQANLKKELAEEGRNTSAVGLYYHGGKVFHLLTLKPGMRDKMGDDLPASLKKLDVLVLSRFIFQESLGFSKEDLNNEKIFHYQSDMGKAIASVRAGTHQLAFLLNPTRIDHVKEVATNGLIMPRKSTFFYPKVLTGLVFNKIDPHEIIQLY
ncbi:MAG: DUF1015 domain-containing protein [Deltaproteobacteria bacterium]|jgi:uncharacterized protein (DUF1015 family)